MALETLQIDKTNAIGRIELRRPEKRNAISPTMAIELTKILTDFESDPEVRVVSLRGAEGNFCSGGDLTPNGKSAPRSGSPTANTLDLMNRVYGETIRKLHRFPKPVVAIVEGIAAGAGANLALACDLVYASPTARFSEIFVKRGIALDCGGSWLLPRLVGMQKAKELAFFGDWVSAEEARAIGLVNAIFDGDSLEEAVEEKLRRLSTHPPIVLTQIKQSLHRAASVTMNEALEIEALAQAACAATEDFAEGMSAFMEKREPDFKGR
ncbi:MAG: enoyl-CoA hydratase [bacterium]|nr:enoyl-CoA hydratase [bacterium]